MHSFEPTRVLNPLSQAAIPVAIARWVLPEPTLPYSMRFSRLGIKLTLRISSTDSLLPNTVTHNWIKLVRRAGLDGIRLHDARHTHASLMLKQGVHPKIVQERLGHSSIQITLDTYSHVAPGMQRKAAEAFDEVIISQ